MEADILEHILDGREKPTNLPFSLLKNITEHFSEDRVIGQGGFATVYKGILPNMTVVVKRIRNNHSIDEKLFYREVDSLLAINHQNVVRFLGFCASTDQTAIKVEGSRQHIYAEIRERLLCFEYMSNGSLQKYITDELRGLEWNTRYQIIKGICEGLHHLHKEKHIYHMDLKPGNILLDDHMMPKIKDFGLSRLDEKSQTMTEDRYGSLGYCAPEYLRSGKMSFKSDMFSLGIIITQLVTGDKGIPDNNNNVLRRWRHRWKKSGMEVPLIYQQVAKCIEIGILCQELDPSKRPFIWDMIHDIREMEVVNGETSNAYEYAFGQISPYSEDDMLGVEPLVLHFPFELNKQISCSLQLTNQTDAYIAFSILNMSPLPYCTQPNKGIVPPRSKCNVDITLQAQDKAPRNMRHAEEFIVWSTKVNDDLAADDITTNMFNKECGMVDAVNLDVVFNAEKSTRANDGPAVEDITRNTFNNEACVVDKRLGVAWPSPYPVKGTGPLLAGVLPSPARSTPRRFFKQPFPPPSLLKHIKARLAKRLGGGRPKEGMILEEGVVGAGASGGLIRDRAEAEMSLDKKVGRGHSADIYFDTVEKGDYKGQTIAVKIISKTKVYTHGAMDRSIDISQYAGYDELRHALARTFSVEGQLEELRRIGWQLVYVDYEDDVLLLGDDPWEEFVNCVKCIRILSPQEVQQMRLDGDLGNQSSPESGLLQLGWLGENFGATHQLRKEVGRGSDIVKKGEYKEQTVAVNIISTTKVCKRGAVGRSIVISQYAGYDELKLALARIFSIDGQLEERGKIGYKLLYIDREDNVLLVGNDPWEDFVNCVKCIRILSPQEVQQFSLGGDVRTNALPNQACSSSDGRGDVLKARCDQNSGNPSTGSDDQFE